MVKQYKSTCFSCGREWSYTRKDLSRSNLNRRKNGIRRGIGNGASILGEKKMASAIDKLTELPEVAHQCPSCGSKNVSLEVIKDNNSNKLNTKMIKFIIVSAIVLISIITISICATVLFYKSMNQVAEVPVSNEPVSTEAPVSEEPVPTEAPEQPTSIPEEEPKTEAYLIGSDKDTVRTILNEYEEKVSAMGDNAIDFNNKDLLITVFFNNEKADGVIFLSNNLDSMNTVTGEGSYVSEHYDELVKLASVDPDIKIESDLTKFNSQGNKKYASELYIGNTPYDNAENSNAPVSPPANEPTQSSDVSSANTEESEFSYCLESGIVSGVKIYLKPNNESYVGTITAFNDEVYNERGKKEKGVYLSGGSNDGWYKRSEIRRCYVRKDDPNLPSYRLTY